MLRIRAASSTVRVRGPSNIKGDVAPNKLGCETIGTLPNAGTLPGALGVDKNESVQTLVALTDPTQEVVDDLDRGHLMGPYNTSRPISVVEAYANSRILDDHSEYSVSGN
jgi:hypothetical protein